MKYAYTIIYICLYIMVFIHIYKTDQTYTCSDPEKIETMKFTTF